MGRGIDPSTSALGLGDYFLFKLLCVALVVLILTDAYDDVDFLIIFYCLSIFIKFNLFREWDACDGGQRPGGRSGPGFLHSNAFLD